MLSFFNFILRLVYQLLQQSANEKLMGRASPDVLIRQHKRGLMFAVFIQRCPIHSMFVGQARQIKIRCPAARGRGRAVENFQIAGNKMRLNFLVPERQHFPRFLHRRAKSRLGRDAEKTNFSDRADGNGLSFLPSDDALVMFVVCPQPRQQGGDIQQVGHGCSVGAVRR